MALSDTAKLVASLELQDKFTKPLAAADKGLTGFEKHAGSLSRIGNEASRGLGNLAANIGKIGLAAGGLAVTGLIASVNAASDLNETVSKVGVVFGDAAPKVLAFGETAAAALGLSKNAALGAAGTFGNLFVSMGLADAKKIGPSRDAAVGLQIEQQERRNGHRAGCGRKRPLHRYCDRAGANAADLQLVELHATPFGFPASPQIEAGAARGSRGIQRPDST